MDTKITKYIRCAVCGKELEITILTDDGVDWLGHHRGRPTRVQRVQKCTCGFNIEKLKPSCGSCHFNTHDTCTNEQRKIKFLSQVSDVSDVTLKLMSSNDKCKFYKGDMHKLYKFVEELNTDDPDCLLL